MLKTHSGSLAGSRTEKSVAVLLLLFFMEALVPFLIEVSWLPPHLGKNIERLLAVAVLFVSILLVARCRQQVWRLVKQEKWLWILVGLAVVSPLWSYAPEMTLRRLIYLLNATLFGIYLAARYGSRERLRLLAWAFGIAAALSLAFALLLPGYGIMGVGHIENPEHLKHLGAWRGVFQHKNILGRTMVFGGLVFFFVARSSRQNAWIAWTGLSLCVAITLASTSKSALVVLVAGVALWLFYRALQWSYTTWGLPVLSATLALGSGITALLALNVETILAAMGRDLTLSGRTGLWAAVLDKLWERPWLGYGYGGFWLNSEGGAATDVWLQIGDTVPHGHNGFLDLAVNLGLLGGLAFALSFGVACVRAIRLVRHSQRPERFFPLAYLLFFGLINIPESALLRPDSSLFWLLYVAVTLSLHESLSSQLDASQPWQQGEEEAERELVGAGWQGGTASRSIDRD
jgi:O-antigen ligase